MNIKSWRVIVSQKEGNECNQEMVHKERYKKRKWLKRGFSVSVMLYFLSWAVGVRVTSFECFKSLKYTNALIY